MKGGVGIKSNFYFTWVGEGSPVIICHLRTLEGDGNISHGFIWTKSIPPKEHSRQMGEKFSKPGCRNMFGDVYSMKN